jgi:hypothetical protein
MFDLPGAIKVSQEYLDRNTETSFLSYFEQHNNDKSTF